LFGSCVIHILYTGCAKNLKKFRRQKVKCERRCTALPHACQLTAHTVNVVSLCICWCYCCISSLFYQHVFLSADVCGRAGSQMFSLTTAVDTCNDIEPAQLSQCRALAMNLMTKIRGLIPVSVKRFCSSPKCPH